MMITLQPVRTMPRMPRKAEGGRVSPAQKEVHAPLRALGHTVVVCYSAEEAVAALNAE